VLGRKKKTDIQAWGGEGGKDFYFHKRGIFLLFPKFGRSVKHREGKVRKKKNSLGKEKAIPRPYGSWGYSPSRADWGGSKEGQKEKGKKKDLAWRKRGSGLFFKSRKKHDGYPCGTEEKKRDTSCRASQQWDKTKQMVKIVGGSASIHDAGSKKN